MGMQDRFVMKMRKKKFRKPHCLTSSTCGQNVPAINIIICREAQRKSDMTEERKLEAREEFLLSEEQSFTVMSSFCSVTCK